MSRFEDYMLNEITSSSLKQVKKMLNKRKGKISKAVRSAKNMKHATKLLDSIFKKDNIEFIDYDEDCPVPYSPYICFGQSIQHDIEIALTPKILGKKFSLLKFLEELSDIISHELIHRKQWEKYPDEDDKGDEDDEDVPNWLSNIRYFSDPTETEAWAHTIYLDLKKNKYNRLREILKILKGNQKMRKVFIKKLYLYSKSDAKTLGRVRNFFKYAKKD